MSSKSASVKRGSFAILGFWLDQGLSKRAATSAAAANCRTMDDLQAKGWRFFQQQENCGERTIAELNDLVAAVTGAGWPDMPAPRGPWIQRAPLDTLMDELRRRGVAV